MPDIAQITPCILVGDKDNTEEMGCSLLELEVEEHYDLASVFRMRLAMVRGEDGLWTFLDQGKAKPWAKVELQMDFGNGSQPLLTGYVTQVRAHFDPAEGNSYLELAGMDSSCLMNLEEVIKDWPGKSDSDIASDIFNTKYHLTPQVDNTNVTHDDKQSTIIQRETDIQFLKRLAKRNGFECFVKDGKGYFRKPGLTSEPLPELAAHFGDETTLTSFHVNWDLVRPVAAESHQIDVVGKAILSSTVQSSSAPPLGQDDASFAKPPDGRQSKITVRHAMATGLPEMTNLTGAIVDEAAWMIEARGEVDSVLYGNVLEARRRVPIKGVGELFSGMYYLTGVKHVYTVDNYIQRFTARRNATTALPSDFPDGGLF